MSGKTREQLPEAYTNGMLLLSICNTLRHYLPYEITDYEIRNFAESIHSYMFHLYNVAYERESAESEPEKAEVSGK